jgi:transposase
MNAYSLDLRQRVLKDADGGLSTRQVATKYEVSESWVRRLKQRRRECGEIVPRSSQNRRQAKWLAVAEQLQALVEQKADITLRELRDAIGGTLSIPTLGRALRQLQMTFKKK